MLVNKDLTVKLLTILKQRSHLFRKNGNKNGNPLQYSCLGNPMDRGAWQVTAHGVTKSWTRLSD